MTERVRNCQPAAQITSAPESREPETAQSCRHGVPLGGELEFTDQSTIAHAFSSRQSVEM